MIQTLIRVEEGFCEECQNQSKTPLIRMQVCLPQADYNAEDSMDLCADCIDEALYGPKYALIGGQTTMHRTRNMFYYRNNGKWGIEAVMKDGKLVTKCERERLDGLSITPITEEAWAVENKRVNGRYQ